jgi:DNA-binding transcriptional ArsR family regulator
LTLTTQQAEHVLDALGNQNRREILAMLRQRPLAVGEIAAQLPISRPAVSKHLRLLEEAGLVTYEPQGTSNIFYLRAAGFQGISAYLGEFWDEALANFKQLVETTAGDKTL